MIIGVPKEIKAQEHRVGLVPASVKEFTSHGHKVLVESGAGAGINFTDADYEKNGAEIIKSAATVTWYVDGLLIATVPAGHDSVNTGNNFFLGRADSNAGSSTDVNDVNLLFTLIDNVQVIPEPASLSLIGLSLVGLLASRRR